jgi:hypothetical protein
MGELSSCSCCLSIASSRGSDRTTPGGSTKPKSRTEVLVGLASMKQTLPAASHLSLRAALSRSVPVTWSAR